MQTTELSRLGNLGASVLSDVLDSLARRGELLSAEAKARGAPGGVTDGVVRDVQQTREALRGGETLAIVFRRFGIL